MCFQMNEVLNVADLATQTIAQGNAATDAKLTSVNAAITNIVNKLNSKKAPTLVTRHFHLHWLLVSDCLVWSHKYSGSIPPHPLFFVETFFYTNPSTIMTFPLLGTGE